MNIKKGLPLRLMVTFGLVAGGIGLAAPPAHALCHEPWEGDEICIAYGECHILGYEDPLQPGRPAPISEPPDVNCFLK